jgi:hypothetical protein
MSIGEFFEGVAQESITPRDVQLVQEFNALPRDAQREVEDFIAFKRIQTRSEGPPIGSAGSVASAASGGSTGSVGSSSAAGSSNSASNSASSSGAGSAASVTADRVSGPMSASGAAGVKGVPRSPDVT